MTRGRTIALVCALAIPTVLVVAGLLGEPGERPPTVSDVSPLVVESPAPSSSTDGPVGPDTRPSAPVAPPVPPARPVPGHSDVPDR